MAKKALTEQDVAALAAGAAIEANVEAPVVEAVADVVAPVVEAVAEVVEAEASTQNVDTTSATVQLLSAQLKEKDEALLQAGIKLAKLEEFKAEAEATHGPLLAIAAKSLGNMHVALGGSAVSVEGMGAAAVLAEHARMTEQFQSKFKVGGVAAVQGDAATTQTQIDPRHMARVNAARHQK